MAYNSVLCPFSMLVKLLAMYEECEKKKQTVIGWLTLLVICNRVHGNNLDLFVKDLVTEFKLRRPTILLDDELPELCFTHHWMLCLSAAPANQPRDMVARWLYPKF